MIAATEAAPPTAAWLSGLTAAQKQAATADDRPLLVVAGPGSGKTKTLVARLAFLIEGRAVPAAEILAVTFTRKAAAELRSRLAAALGPTAATLAVGTFHGAALLLKPLGAGRPATGLAPLLLGEADRLLVAQQVVAEYGSQVRGSHSAAAAKLVEFVSLGKGQRCDWLEALGELSPGPASAWLPSAARRYQALLGQLGGQDLDDLLIAATEAVRSGRAARRFRYVLVDEYQDVNGVQRQLLAALGAAGSSLFAIGDPDQAIYAFRGAEVAHFFAFERDFADAQRLYLAENFRSTATLVSAATQLIAHNRDRLPGPAVTAVQPGGECLIWLPAQSPQGEAIAIAREIDRLIGGSSLSAHDRRRGEDWTAGRYGFSDIAILARTAARADRIADALAHEGLPILRPRRTAAEGEPSARVQRRLRAVVSAVSDPSPLREDEPAPPLPATVGELHESDGWDARLSRVAVLTLHGAKGLEFPVVFVVGCEAELLPGSGADAAETAEARRLFYVGLTRARERVYLSHLAGHPPSPFLAELPPSLVLRPPPPPLRPRPPQLKLF